MSIIDNGRLTKNEIVERMTMEYDVRFNLSPILHVEVQFRLHVNHRLTD